MSENKKSKSCDSFASDIFGNLRFDPFEGIEDESDPISKKQRSLFDRKELEEDIESKFNAHNLAWDSIIYRPKE